MLNNYSKLANRNYSSEPITDFSKPNAEVLRRTMEGTKLEIDKHTNVKIKSITGQGSNVNTVQGEAKFVRYTPTQQGLGHNSGKFTNYLIRR